MTTTATKKTLTDHEVSTLANGMRAAADVYTKLAKESANNARIARQFREQAREANDLVDLLDGSPEITIVL